MEKETLFEASSRFPDGVMTAIWALRAAVSRPSCIFWACYASKGQVILNGRDVSSLTDAQRAALRANHIGFVFQDAVLDLSQNDNGQRHRGSLFTGVGGGWRLRYAPVFAGAFRRGASRPSPRSGVGRSGSTGGPVWQGSAQPANGSSPTNRPVTSIGSPRKRCSQRCQRLPIKGLVISTTIQSSWTVATLFWRSERGPSNT